MKRKIKFVVMTFQWFDKYAGNSYSSSQIVRCRDGATIHCPYELGWDSYSRQVALRAMAAAKWLPVAFRGREESMSYERLNNYPILWHRAQGTKAECKAHGQA